MVEEFLSISRSVKRLPIEINNSAHSSWPKQVADDCAGRDNPKGRKNHAIYGHR
jgi:hypothetical protein